MPTLPAFILRSEVCRNDESSHARVPFVLVNFATCERILDAGDLVPGAIDRSP